MNKIKLSKFLILFGLCNGVCLSMTTAASASNIKTWWGTWDTENYNRTPGTTKPPVGFYPPSDESLPPDKYGNIRTAWKWYDASNAADPLQAKWVRGANRTVIWKAPGTSHDWRIVSGTFNEPNIKGVNLSRKTNKPTYYFGMEGQINMQPGVNHFTSFYTRPYQQ